MPVPRNVFINRSQLDKASKEFIDAATPEPSKEALPTGPHAERLAWKQRLSALRRRNLREGVTSLHQRKQKMDQYLSSRGAQRQHEQNRLINQPPRDDEVFTNPSVSKAVLDFLNSSRIDHSQDQKEVERKKLRVSSREAIKSDLRRSALHTLYLHAREYITTEEQLSTTIDETFGFEGNLPRFSPYSSAQARSIWARDAPPTTAMLLGKQQGQSRTALDANEGYLTPTQKRIQRIAEELTGGKI